MKSHVQEQALLILELGSHGLQTPHLRPAARATSVGCPGLLELGEGQPVCPSGSRGSLGRVRTVRHAPAVGFSPSQKGKLTQSRARPPLARSPRGQDQNTLPALELHPAPHPPGPHQRPLASQVSEPKPWGRPAGRGLDALWKHLAPEDVSWEACIRPPLSPQLSQEQAGSQRL